MKRPVSLDGGGTGRAAVRGPVLSPHLVAGLARFDLGEETLLLARELAGMAGALEGHERRGLELLALASLVSTARGSTRLPVAREVREPLRWLFGELGLSDAEREAGEAAADAVVAEPGAFEPVVGAPGDYRPLLVAGGSLYHQRAWVLETRVAAHLADRLQAPLRDRPVDRALQDVEAEPPRLGSVALRHSDEQRDAIRVALRAPLTVISGGPGTGKTSVIVSILRALARLETFGFDDVALAAPTGKAADRMRQSVARALGRVRTPALADRALLRDTPSAFTLHRLLGYSPRSGRFRHHERNPIQSRFVVVDESSMIDLALMDRLLRALSPEAQLVLLGDASQLPSVQAGAVFRDLCRHGGERVVTLTQSYRMDPSDPAGQSILSAAECIEEGRAKALFEPSETQPVRTASSPETIAFEGTELVEARGARGRQGVLERWARLQDDSLADREALVARRWSFRDGALRPEDEPDLERLFVHAERFRVLCLTQGRATGVGAINTWFRARAAGEGGTDPDAPLPGEPLIVLRNDYDRDLFNGDQGLVLRTEKGTAAVFRREGGFVALPFESVRNLVDAAWAITVHKAQGSEFDHVLIVLPASDTPLLNRELLYTGLTRARRSVLWMGARAMLERGVHRAIVRSSGIGDRLAQSSSDGAAGA